MDTQQPIYVARVETSSAVAEFVDESAIMEADDQCTTWLDADRDFARIEYFCATEAEARHHLEALGSVVRDRFPAAPWSAAAVPLPYENWAETWKRFFHAEKVSDRLWIKPSWETCTPAPGEQVIAIDPGMSFGTGQHGTTRGCLRFMDTLARARPGLRLLDAGCGSGILAIAAARLGYTAITAIDNDPDAVRIARENAALNGVADAIAFRTAELAALGGTPPFDVVVANILATVLIANAPILASLCSTHSANNSTPRQLHTASASLPALILSGILNPQAADVAAAFAATGFEVRESLELGEWTTLWLQRRAR